MSSSPFLFKITGGNDSPPEEPCRAGLVARGGQFPLYCTEPVQPIWGRGETLMVAVSSANSPGQRVLQGRVGAGQDGGRQISLVGKSILSLI